MDVTLNVTLYCDPQQELQKAEERGVGTGNQSEGAPVRETNSAPQQTPSTGAMQRGCYAAPLWSLKDLQHMRLLSTCR